MPSVRDGSGSGGVQHALAEQVQSGAAENRPLDQLQVVDLPFDRAVAPGLGDGGATAELESRAGRGRGIYHSTWPSTAIANPVLNTTIRGEGAAGWPGWFASAEMERLTAE